MTLFPIEFPLNMENSDPTETESEKKQNEMI